MTRAHRFQWSAILPMVALILASCGGSSTGNTASSVSANTSGNAGPSFKPLCTPQGGKNYKVALIIAQGGLGDQSYNDLAYSGFQKAKGDFPIVGRVIQSADIVSQGQAIVQQAGQASFDGLPVIALWDVAIPSYRPDECPQCAQGLPLVKPGTTPAPAIRA